MARRTFPPSSYDERRVKKREKKMRGGGRDPDESERRGGMGGRLLLFCLLEFSQRRNVELCVTPLAHPKKVKKSSSAFGQRTRTFSMSTHAAYLQLHKPMILAKC